VIFERRRPYGLDFLIVCLGRTGSTHLMALLDSSPGVRCFGELFYDEVSAFLSWPDHDHHAFVADALGKGPEKRGFKYPLDSMIAFPQTIDLLRDRRVRIIRLTRRNRLAHLLSARLAAVSGVWYSDTTGTGAASERPERRVCLGLDECLAWFRVNLFYDAVLDELCRQRPTFRLEYHEIPTRAADALHFLGVDAGKAQLTSPYRKLRTRPMHEVIENWDELAAGLRGTRWEEFLEEEPI
jgi:hypothetical protein